MTQPEALALADILDRSVLQAHADAAAELRRLHDEVTELQSDLVEEVLLSNAMLEVKEELLAALKALVEADAPDYIKSSIWEQARAAIAKGEAK
jgi:hypothetical protein